MDTCAVATIVAAVSQQSRPATEGDTLLKDVLQALLSKSGGESCRFGRLMRDELDQETADVLASAMRSKASTRSIWLALRADGHTVDRATVTSARQCFRGESQCRCGYGEDK